MVLATAGSRGLLALQIGVEGLVLEVVWAGSASEAVALAVWLSQQSLASGEPWFTEAQTRRFTFIALHSTPLCTDQKLEDN